MHKDVVFIDGKKTVADAVRLMVREKRVLQPYPRTAAASRTPMALSPARTWSTRS